MKVLLFPCALALSLLLSTGCQRPEEVPRPANLLSKEQVASLLIRLHLLEARTESSRLSTDSARSLFLAWRHELLWSQHISESDSTLEHSYHYYALHDKDLEDVYAIVVDSLQAVERQQGLPMNQQHQP